MPFMLYDVAGQRYQHVRIVKIAGSNGPLASIQRQRNTKLESPFPWHATSADIVESIGGQSGQEIVIDLKPHVSKNGVQDTLGDRQLT